MKPSSSKLISYWRSQNLRIAPGNPEGKVREFESRYGVVLPPDFREYFIGVDGMTQVGGHDCDPTGFAFWPLARLKSVVEECAEHSLALPEVSDPDRYFVFADYLQWSWAYAIHLSDRPSGPNPVIHVGTIRPKVVAGSFTEFVDLYLRDARELYVDAETVRPAP
jgi:SMI1 / KNR4 family (SUKH-1)